MPSHLTPHLFLPMPMTPLWCTGMSWWQGILTVFVGNVITLVPMVLNAHPGTKYGIPFPVLVGAGAGVGMGAQAGGGLVGLRSSWPHGGRMCAQVQVVPGACARACATSCFTHGRPCPEGEFENNDAAKALRPPCVLHRRAPALASAGLTYPLCPVPSWHAAGSASRPGWVGGGLG